jgi:uncharacterized protein (TIGR03437 family)
LYYQAGIDLDASQQPAGYLRLDTWYGAETARDGKIAGHQRVRTALGRNPYDFTYAGSGAGGRLITGAGGTARIGSGNGPILGISIALKAPEVAGSGVYLHPGGVVNAASFAPFTAGIAPGQYITLYGANLAPRTEVAGGSPLPATLAGVQVMVNGRPAPLYMVSPAQLSVLVPYATEAPVARVQVVNNGAASAVVPVYVNRTAPGVFTIPPGGMGYAAALHPDGSLVTPSRPAQVGERVAVFVTGLGAVSMGVPDGAAGPDSPLSAASSQISTAIDGRLAMVSFAGLAPGALGLYQINVEVPHGIHAGDVLLDLAGPDALTSQALIPVASGAGTLPNSATETNPAARRRLIQTSREGPAATRDPAVRFHFDKN